MRSVFQQKLDELLAPYKLKPEERTAQALRAKEAEEQRFCATHSPLHPQFIEHVVRETDFRQAAAWRAYLDSTKPALCCIDVQV